MELHLADGDGRSLAPAMEFPWLEKGIAVFNKNERQNAKKINNRIREQALEEEKERGDAFYPYYDENNIYVRRADELVLSFLAFESQYTGGAHGDFGVRGYNLDTVTGKPLRISEALYVSDFLAEAISKQLLANYPPETFFEGLEEKVAREAANETINWSLGPRGVTFYFNPYDIAPYASGMLTATILADEQPGFFREKYLRAPAAYCEYLLPGYTADIVLLDGPGATRNKLYVDCYDNMIKIGFKGQLLTFDPTNQMGAEDIVPIFVHTKDGRNYLYIDCANTATGEREIRFYSLDGETAPDYVGKAANTFSRPFYDSREIYTRWWIMTDPEEFPVELFTGKDAETHIVNVSHDGQLAFG